MYFKTYRIWIFWFFYIYRFICWIYWIYDCFLILYWVNCSVNNKIHEAGSKLWKSSSPSRALFTVTADCSGLCPAELWNSPRMETPQPLWQTHDDVIVVFQDMSFSRNFCVWIPTLNPAYVPPRAVQLLNFWLPWQYVDCISGIFSILMTCMWKTHSKTKNIIPLGCIRCVQQCNAELISVMLNKFIIDWNCLWLLI